MEEEVTRAVELAVKRFHSAAADLSEEVGADSNEAEEEEQQKEDGIMMTEVAGEVCTESQVTAEGGSKKHEKEQNLAMGLGNKTEKVKAKRESKRCGW